MYFTKLSLPRRNEHRATAVRRELSVLRDARVQRERTRPADWLAALLATAIGSPQLVTEARPAGRGAA